VFAIHGYLPGLVRLKICTIDTKIPAVKLTDQVNKEGSTANSQAESKVSTRLEENISGSSSGYSCFC
jgi:hypothetical protein